MTKKLDQKIRNQLRRLQNPYAFVDYLYGDELSLQGEVHSAISRTWSDLEIERFVRELQLELWEKRFELWATDVPKSPVHALDVTKAAELLGFRIELSDDLGSHDVGGKRIQTAGLIDRAAALISIYSALAPTAKNFTAAHELGHIALHPHLELVHRDRAIDGERLVRPTVEREADRFATLFLMPAKVVRVEFVERFGHFPFELTDDTAFGLLKKSLVDAKEKFGSKAALAEGLASARRYDSAEFYSMAQIFNVSNQAMAIRLKELDLVK